MAKDKHSIKRNARIRRAQRVRSKVQGTADRPRLAVFKSLNHLYAQLIDDGGRKTIAGVSSLKGGLNVKGNKTEKAVAVGEAIAKKAQELGIKAVVFDRSGYAYHGKVKALAEAARKTGLEF
ncbi:MAG: 50S ribosomal protein L18 [candidate division Zixibacteria bacterium]